jgi:lactoylglutathione lyase
MTNTLNWRELGMKLLQIRLLVSDFKQSADFYRDVLEFPVSWYEESMEYALFNNEPKQPGSAPGFLLNLSVEDVDAAYNKLREKGVLFITEPHDRKEWNARIAHFQDPDGNLLEIYKTL